MTETVGINKAQVVKSPDDIFDQVSAGMILTDDEMAAMGLGSIPIADEIKARIKHGRNYLDFLSERGIGGANLKRALTHHTDEAGQLLGRRMNVAHPYHSALFAFDRTTEILFDNARESSGVDETDTPEFFECFPIWARYSTSIAATATEDTIRSLITYLHYFSELLIFARLLKKDEQSTLEEKLVPLEAIVIFLKELKPLKGIRWQSIHDLEDPMLFPTSDSRHGFKLIHNAEFIADESMMAYNLIKAAYAAMNFQEGDAFSKADRGKARAYFVEHKKEMGKRAYLWDNLLAEVFDYADGNFPDEEEVVDIERRGVLQRSEGALAGGHQQKSLLLDGQSGKPRKPLSYADHPFGQYFQELFGDVTADANDGNEIRSIHKTVKAELSKARKWLKRNQLDSPEILEVLRAYEIEWEFYIELFNSGIYTLPASNTCVFFQLPLSLKKIIKDLSAKGKALSELTTESKLAFWGTLEIKPEEMSAQEFLGFYERLHQILFLAIEGVEMVRFEKEIAKFAVSLNNLMYVLKSASDNGHIVIDKFTSIADGSSNIHGKMVESVKVPIKIHTNEEILLYFIIETCHELIGHTERDIYNENDRRDTLTEILEKSSKEGVIPKERHRDRAEGYRISLEFLQAQLPKIFALADEMFAGKQPQGPAVAMPAVAISDGIGAPPDVAAGATSPGSPAAMPPDDAGNGEDEYELLRLPDGVDALLPPGHEIPPSEIETFEQLRDIVKREWRINNTKTQDANRRIWEAKAALAKDNCDDRASVVAGNFEGTARITATVKEEIFLERRNLKAIVFPSNLKCTGTAKLEIKKKSYLLHWQLDEKGQLAFVIGGKTYNERAFFQGMPPLRNFYLETQSIILQQLERLLVRQVRELKARTWGAVLSQEEIDKVRPVRTRGGTGIIMPRFENLLGRSVSDGSGKAGPTVTVVGRKAMELLERIKAGDVILEDDANGIILYLELEEKIEAGKRVEPLYMPCNTIHVLKAVANNKLPLDEVFVMSSDHRVGRAGYHPYRDTENPGLLIATQRTPHEESEAVQRAIENQFKVHLSTTVGNTTAITIPKDGAAIEAIMIGTHEQIEANTADTIHLEEVSKWAKGERDSISQIARDRIGGVIIETEDGKKQSITPETVTELTKFEIFRVILNAEQRPQFTIGSYESLADVQRKLVTEESAAEQAAAETAPV